MRRSKLILSSAIVLILHTTLATPARGDGGAGVAVAIGIEIFKELKELLGKVGGAAVYVKAKVDGPDDDDFKIKSVQDEDHGFESDLKADTGEIVGKNNKNDDNQEDYDAGSPHKARIKMHFIKDDGWGPKVGDNKGFAQSSPDDDPHKGDQPTRAAAVGVFTEKGTVADACYQAESQGGEGKFNVRKVPCSPIPEFKLEQASVFLAGEERFLFANAGENQVLIIPLFEIVDLFHVYLQAEGNKEVFPLLRGLDPLVQELKREIYLDSIAGTDWILTENPARPADLTIVGIALRLHDLQIARNGRSNHDLLAAYFSSNAVEVVAPRHAQVGYVPQVTFRQQVASGQDISDLVGQDFVVPGNGDPEAGVEEEPLVGIIVGVRGGMDDAVALGANTEGHFVRNLINAASSGTADTVEFKIPGTSYHREDGLSFSDLDTASPDSDDTPPICRLYGTTDGGIEILAQDTGTGLRNIETLQEENATVNKPKFSPGTTDPVIVTATKIDPKKRSRVQLRVTDMEDNSVTCDPVLATVRIRPQGGPSRQTFEDLPEAEGKITVQNGSPGLKRLYFEVNGVEFRMLWLRAGETRDLNVSSAMLPGDRNVITMTGFGPPRASASVTIHD